MLKYGFLGIGIMGRAMAENMLKAGLDLTVWNRSQEKCLPLVDMGASLASTPAAAVAACDITFAMVSDPEAARKLCLGKDGALEGISTGKGYIDVSTVDDTTSKELHQVISAKGGRFLEAPVTGSKKPAEDGQLVFLCAGDRSLYEDAGEALAVMGKKSFFFPEVGQGARMKLVNNLVMGTMLVAISEGLSLADRLGLNSTEVLEVFSQGVVNAPLLQAKGPLMVSGNFTPAFPLKHMQKDMRLAIELGEQLGQKLACSIGANAAYLDALQGGNGDLDFSVVITALKRK